MTQKQIEERQTASMKSFQKDFDELCAKYGILSICAFVHKEQSVEEGGEGFVCVGNAYSNLRSSTLNEKDALTKVFEPLIEYVASVKSRVMMGRMFGEETADCSCDKCKKAREERKTEKTKDF